MSLARMRMATALHEPEMSEDRAESEFFDCVAIFHRRNSSEYRVISHAYKIVKHEYRDIKRHELDSQGNRKPYISHLRTVAFAMMFLGHHDYVTVVVALLHDLREDFPKIWTFARMVEEFGQEIAEEVESITRPYDDGRLNRATPRVKRVKIIDRLHNMKTYDLYPTEKRARKIRETIDKLLPIAQQIGFSDELQFFLRRWTGVELH